MYDAHIICRFSTQDKEDASIERQKEQCLEVAKTLGCSLENTKIIANDNLSGGLPWDKRTDLQDLERDIRTDQCQRVIVYRFDRLARDFEVSGKLLNLLSHHNIELYDESGKLDYLTASGQAFFGMKAVFAGFERAIIRERTYAGKKQKAKNGYYVGGAIPLGYVLDVEKRLPNGEINPNYKKLKPYPPHAEIVKEIFYRLKSDGVSSFSLALAFHREGKVIPEFEPAVKEVMKGRTGLKEISRAGDRYRITPRVIRNIATNPAYLGVWRWGKEVSVTQSHEPLIDEDTFWLVYKKVTKGHVRKGKAAYTEPLPLSGLLFCKEHSCPVHARSIRRVYICCSRYRSGEESRSHFHIASYVLDNPIAEFVLKQCSYSTYADEVLGKLEEERQNWMTRIADIQNRRRKLEQEIGNLKNSLALARNPEEVTYFLDGIQSRKEALVQLEREANQPKKNLLGSAEIKLIHEFLSNLFAYWDRIPNTLKNQFLCLVLDHIDISYTKENETIEVIIHWHSGKIQCILIDCHSHWTEPDWSCEEEGILKELWGTENMERITEALPRRSWSSIKTKAHRMGLKRYIQRNHKVKYPGWRAWEESLIMDLYEDKITVDNVVCLTRRTPKAIYEKAKRMGLSKSPRQRLRVSWQRRGSSPVTDGNLHVGGGDEPLPVRLLWRPGKGVHLLANPDLTLSEAH